MRRLGILLLAGMIAALAVEAANLTREEWEEARLYASLPRDLISRVPGFGEDDGYQIDFRHLNPFFLWGDFDGDGGRDYAVRLTRAGESRLAVLRAEGSYGD